MHYAKLTKLSDNVTLLRTNEMDGLFFEVPVVGKSFVITGQAINPKASVRLIYTSKVKRIELKGEKTIVLTTQNSVYQVDLTGAETFSLNDNKVAINGHS